MQNMGFPQRLLDARATAGLSQTQLAAAANIAPGQVNRYEAGKNTPRPHVMAKLAGALGVFPEWLASGNGPRESGSKSAYSEHLDVVTRERVSGGMDISMQMDEEMFRVVKTEAQKAGLPIDDFLKELLLEQVKRRANQTSEELGLGDIVQRLAALEKQQQELASRVLAPSDIIPSKKI